ncbi:hypothetical protein MPTK2_1g24130 [Marchantia polymorpha subsp. ruderalis]
MLKENERREKISAAAAPLLPQLPSLPPPLRFCCCCRCRNCTSPFQATCTAPHSIQYSRDKNITQSPLALALPQSFAAPISSPPRAPGPRPLAPWGPDVRPVLRRVARRLPTAAPAGAVDSLYSNRPTTDGSFPVTGRPSGAPSIHPSRHRSIHLWARALEAHDPKLRQP